MKKGILIYVVGWILVIITVWNLISLTENKINSEPGTIDYGRVSPTASKAEIVAEINHLRNQIIDLEAESGVSGKEGFTVYPAAVSSRLYSLYEALSLRLHFLKTGANRISSGQWEGYPFLKKNDHGYTVADAFAVIADLKKNGVPDNLLQNLHIFLLPYSIPEISGLGGAGYTLIGAAAEISSEQLAVTLNHEIGHHIHLSFMPEGDEEGKANWERYLRLRGGDWHDPGEVNTAAWSNSSEETFAEDFRMLFGKNQPYYNDLALGDPRDNSRQAGFLKEFMVSLAQEPPKEQYSSPWIPRAGEVSFWRLQSLLITVVWVFLGISGLVLKSQARPERISPKLFFHEASYY